MSITFKVDNEVREKHLASEVIEVNKYVDDCKMLIKLVGHGVPLAVKNKICARKLRIVVAC